MTDTRKVKVFLCHASQDKPVVRELYARLSSEAWIDSWLDEEKLLPGVDWDMEIERAVRDSDVVIVCLSKNSLNKRGFVQKEIKMALDIADQIPDGQIYIIPLRLENCEVPSRLAKWQWVNYFEDKVFTYNLLMTALKSKIVTLPTSSEVEERIVQLENELSNLKMELTFAYDATIEAWAKALELRDRETAGHTSRVTELSVLFAAELGLSQQEIINIRRGALLHDVGKIGIPDDVLLKPGPLSVEEAQLLKRHTSLAYEMLSPVTYLRDVLDIPYCHHERWDGTGFPRGLKENEIPLSARIFTLVDAWDALRSDRPYRRSWSVDKILMYIQDQAGISYDPELVPVFVSLIERLVSNDEYS
jgi:HD-GYP domain-containing protein (c-di-GMP phosphodiesterase class II)